jgi:hypothetical protein
VVPDAGNTWLIGYTGAYGQQGVYAQDNEGGGTSGASPLIVGLEADAMQPAGRAAPIPTVVPVRAVVEAGDDRRPSASVNA